MSVKVIHRDLWPSRDNVCHKAAYDFRACNSAIALCKKTDTVIQAGGNVGVWPRYLKTIFGEVYTFEPSPENFGLMKQNLNGSEVKAYNAALYDIVGRCSIKINPLNCGDDQTIEGDEIETITIDSLDLSPDLIYLDIQGDEYRALIGGNETIERCSPVIAIEYDKKMRTRSSGDAVELLGSLGYTKIDQYAQDWIFIR